MKKFISLVLAIMLVTYLLPVAHAAEYNGFVCQKNSAGNYVIMDFKDYSATSVKIPEKINGIKVTAVGRGAFQQKNNITSIVIPATVSVISSMSFYGCKNLTSVTLSTTVKSIGSKAFAMCTKLKGINLQNVQTVGEHAFFGCKSLKTLKCGSSLKVIGAYAFENCSSIDTFVQSPVLLYVGNYAFSGCSALPSISFPNSVSYIGNSAFQNCKALQSVTFGSGALTIDSYAFENCSGLTAVTIPNSVKSIGRCAFALRPANSTKFSHKITITCSRYAPGMQYAKTHNVDTFVKELNKKIVCFGDLNANDKCDANDARQLLRIAASVDYGISGEKLFLCDINCNGKIDVGDANYVLLNR